MSESLIRKFKQASLRLRSVYSIRTFPYVGVGGMASQQSFERYSEFYIRFENGKLPIGITPLPLCLDFIANNAG